jgi:hypothetical protein
MGAVLALLLNVDAVPASARAWSEQAASVSFTPAVESAAPSFGAFAGYAWPGHVTSVRGSWVVPRILRASSLGDASTWIGAQAPGLASAKTPFIQVGTSDVRLRGLDFFFAWWSDTAHHFYPVPLFFVPVRPGDRVSASLRLRRGHWTVSISDARTRTRARFLTRQETRARFNLAIWTQEDPTDPRTLKQGPYPELSAISFSRLAVNSAVPLGADLLSQWMSENGQILGPTQLVDDGFALVPQQPTAAGSQYQALADPVNAALTRFTTDAQRWTAKTATASIARQRSTLASALQTCIGSLAADQWPSAAQTAINTLIAALRTALAQVQTAPARSAARIRTWIRTFRRDAHAATEAARALRAELGLPTYG